MTIKIYASSAALEKMTYAPEVSDFWNNPATYDAENDTMTASYDDDGNIYIAIDENDAEAGIFSEIEKFYAVEWNYTDSRSSDTDYFPESEKEIAIELFSDRVERLARSDDKAARVAIFAVYGYRENGGIVELGLPLDNDADAAAYDYLEALEYVNRQKAQELEEYHCIETIDEYGGIDREIENFESSAKLNYDCTYRIAAEGEAVRLSRVLGYYDVDHDFQIVEVLEVLKEEKKGER